MEENFRLEFKFCSLISEFLKFFKEVFNNHHVNSCTDLFSAATGWIHIKLDTDIPWVSQRAERNMTSK